MKDPLRSYLFIELKNGYQAKAVGTSMQGLEFVGAKITAIDECLVGGPYDLIATFEADDLDRLGTAITQRVHKLPGIHRTTTCLVVNFD